MLESGEVPFAQQTGESHKGGAVLDDLTFLNRAGPGEVERSERLADAVSRPALVSGAGSVCGHKTEKLGLRTAAPVQRYAHQVNL
jgi:hypothetical protein